MNLSSAAGGITIAGGVNVYTSSMGNMNALAVPPAGTGMTALTLSNGALYYSPIRMRATGMVGGHTATVTAYVSTNFSHPVAAIMYGCPTNLGCTSYSDYTVLSTNAATPTTLGISPMTNNIWYTGGLAIFVPDNDGASAFAGTNTVTITFRVNESVNNRTDTATLNLTAITQTAVQLTLGTAAGGATIAAGADFSLNFGNVNGLGIGPAAGFATTSVAGGYVYSTPYLLQPAFAEFSNTTASINVSVTSNFAHPTQLILQDATASAGPFTAVPIAPVTATTLTSSAADRSTITRYLGLFVSNANGPTIYTGSDSATLTFTLTVP